MTNRMADTFPEAPETTECPTDWRAPEVDASIEDEPALRGDGYALPIPGPYLRAACSIDRLGPWYAIGEAWAGILSRFLPAEPVVLDIGCGCGKIARFLTFHPRLRYIGVDIFQPAILWCRSRFGPVCGDRFRFEHFDGISEIYNPGGSLRPSEYRFSAGDRSIDMAVCASLFTHLLEPDCVHYLEEIGRVLKDGGKALISIHDEPPPGSRFAGDETRIDIDEAYFVELAARAGLVLSRQIGNVYGQQVLLFERRADAGAHVPTR